MNESFLGASSQFKARYMGFTAAWKLFELDM